MFCANGHLLSLWAASGKTQAEVYLSHEGSLGDSELLFLSSIYHTGLSLCGSLFIYLVYGIGTRKPEVYSVITE